MTPKIVLVSIGALMTLHGIGLYFSAGSIAEYTDPTEAMIAMGAKLNETIGIMTLLVGVILLASLILIQIQQRKLLLLELESQWLFVVPFQQRAM